MLFFLAFLLFMFVSLACFYEFCYGGVGSTLLEIPRLLGALVVAQVAGLVQWFFVWFWLRGQQDSRILFSLGCGCIKNARRFFGFIRRSWAEGGFLAVCFFLFSGFLIAASNVIPSLVDLVYC
jgi:hypothetical protein